MSGRHYLVIAALTAAPDGLTAREVAQAAGYASQEGAMQALKALHGQGLVYIDRWTGPHHGRWAGVWMLGNEHHAPRPDHVAGAKARRKAMRAEAA